MDREVSPGRRGMGVPCGDPLCASWLLYEPSPTHANMHSPGPVAVN